MPEKVHIKFSDDAQLQPQGMKRSRDGSPKSNASNPQPQKRAASVPADIDVKRVKLSKSMMTSADLTTPVKKIKTKDTSTNGGRNDKHLNGLQKVAKPVDPKSFYNSGITSTNSQSTKSSTAATATKPRPIKPSNATTNTLSKSVKEPGQANSTTTNTSHSSNVQKTIGAHANSATSKVPAGTNGTITGAVNGGNLKDAQQRQSALSVNSSQFKPPDRRHIRKLALSLETERHKLPIWSHRADIRWALRQNDVLLLVGETGSGKSTQVPQFVINEPWFQSKKVKVADENGHVKEVHVGGRIAITEPRRVAATSLARRVANETGSYLGERKYYNNEDDVGYSVRFDHNIPPSASIMYLTEGMLLQEMLQDPHLRRYSAIIIDEIHERSVDVDLLAGFLKNIVTGDKQGRGGVPLKVIVMSATANMEGFQRFFSANIGIQSNTDTGTVVASEFSHRNATMGLQEQGKNDSRRTSDASYSSWDGISSDDDLSTPEKEPGSSPNTVESATDPAVLEPNDVAVHHIAGNQYDVETLYATEPVTDYVEAVLKCIFQVHTREELPGDILVFLTGQEEIETLQQLVQEMAEKLNKDMPRLVAVPLYGQLSMEQQAVAFERPRKLRTRKVVLATNIAETSVTVPGVRFVIDCGKAKVKRYRPALGLESLLVQPISQSSAIQRKGRAGREAKGKCYRIYTEKEFLDMRKADEPEILRTNATEAVLKMKARGVSDILSFPLMDPPGHEILSEALNHLHDLGALDDDGLLTTTGKKISDFPLSASYGKVLVAASESNNDCLLETIDVIACLTAGEDIFLQPKTEEKRDEIEEARRGLVRREGDILTYLTTMQQYAGENVNRAAWCKSRSINISVMKQALEIRRQLRLMCYKKGMLAEKAPQDPQPFVPMPPERAEIFLKCFLSGFASKTAILQADRTYATFRGKNTVSIHPSSVMHGKQAEAILFLEHVFTKKNYAKKVSAVQMNWIFEYVTR